MAESDTHLAEFNGTSRQIEHIVPIGFALLLRWLPPWGAGMLAVCGIFYGLFGSCRLAPSAFRDDERKRGYAPGKVIYAAVVLALIVVFPNDLHIVAGAWAMLALGDGCASLAGARWGARPLPWNRQKTWAGLIAFAAAGWLSAAVLMVWVSGRYPDRAVSVQQIFIATLIAALVCAMVESLPTGQWINDNMSVPLVAAGILSLLIGNLQSWPFSFVPRLNLPPALSIAGGLVACVAVGIGALLLGLVRKSAIIGGGIVGLLISLCLGLPGFFVLFTFFALGSACTRFGYLHKAQMGVAQENGGARGTRHALANCSIATLLAVIAAIHPRARLFHLAFVGAFATALADTASSEIGQALGRRAYLLGKTFKRAAVGSEGAVSLPGTIAGIAGSMIVALAGFAAGLHGLGAIPIVIAAALAGNVAESIAGSLGVFGNETLNLFNTAVGAGICLAVGAAFGV